jgi:hypothetical protein
MAFCKSCNAPFIWATTPAGKSMPLEGPTPDGEWVLLTNYETRRATDEDRRLHRPLYAVHWATCPDADRHRTRP